jgi:glycosyltransferase 2 family protein
MRRFWVSFVAANLIGALFLWLTARKLPWADVWLFWERADRAQIAMQSLLFIGIYAISHVARMVRWGALVRPLGEVSWRDLLGASAVGMTAILLLPLRLGELVRPYVLARRTGISTSALLGTAVVERVIDGLVMTGLLFVTLATYHGGRSTDFAFVVGGISAVVFVGAQLVCALALWKREWTVGMVRRVGNVFSTRLTDALALLRGLRRCGGRARCGSSSGGRWCTGGRTWCRCGRWRALGSG